MAYVTVTDCSTNTTGGPIGSQVHVAAPFHCNVIQLIVINSQCCVYSAVSVFCVVTIIGVHLQQTQERVEMHKGVLNDKERIRMKAAAAKEKKNSIATYLRTSTKLLYPSVKN